MSDKITIQDIIELLAEKHGMNKKDAEAFVKGIFDLIEEALASEKYVKVKGLGTFKLTEVESRESVNVNTGERFQIQGHNKISFTPDTTMKDLINKPFAHFETVILNENTQLEDTKIEMEGEDDKEENTEEIISSTPEILKEDDTNTITSTPTYEADIKPITNISDPQKIIAADEIIETVEEQQSIKEDHLTEKASKVAEDTSEERPATIAEAAIKAVREEKTISETIEGRTSKSQSMTASESPLAVPEGLLQKEQKKNLWGIIIAIILVLCIAGGIYWFMQSSSSKQPIRQSIPAATSTVKEMPNDSVTLQQQDTVSGSNLQTREPIQSQPAGVSAEKTVEQQSEAAQPQQRKREAVRCEHLARTDVQKDLFYPGKPGHECARHGHKEEQLHPGAQPCTALFVPLALLRRRQRLCLCFFHHPAAFPSASSTAPMRPSAVRVAPETVSTSADCTASISSSKGSACL